MDWTDGLTVPTYFQRGISFDELLRKYRSFNREHPRSKESAPGMGMEEDTEIGNKKERAVKKLGIQKKALAGIRKHITPSQSSNERSKSGITLTVRNIPYNVVEGQLRSHFSHIGKVTVVRIDRDDNGKSTGQGSVQFISRKDGLTAVEKLQHKTLEGRQLRLAIE